MPEIYAIDPKEYRIKDGKLQMRIQARQNTTYSEWVGDWFTLAWIVKGKIVVSSDQMTGMDRIAESTMEKRKDKVRMLLNWKEIPRY
jgi:hypothetical protein